jgi:hypothetical protein
MTRTNEACPAQVLEWIAWYPDGGLSDEQRGAVEAHAALCAPCREELAVLAGRLEAPVAPADPERLFARVLALVEADGFRAAPAGAGAPVAAPTLRRAPPPIRRSPVWSRRIARGAAAAAVVLVAGGVGGWIARSPLFAAEPVYTPASGPVAGGGAGVTLDVVFRSDATAERIQTALRGLGAELVAGPSPVGRYRVELPAGTDASAAAALLRAEGTGVASFAEPLR